MYKNYFDKNGWYLKSDDGTQEEWGDKITLSDLWMFAVGLVAVGLFIYVALLIF